MAFLTSLVGRLTGNSDRFANIQIDADRLAFSQDGKVLAVYSARPNDVITFLDAGTGKVIKTLKDVPSAGDSRAGSLTFSPDGYLLVFCGMVNKTYVIRFWDTKNYAHLLDLPYKKVDCPPAFSSDGKVIAIAESSGNYKGQYGSTDSQINLVQIEPQSIASGHRVMSCTKVGEAPWRMAFASGDKELVTVRANYVTLLAIDERANLANKREKFVNAGLDHLLVCPDGNTLVTCGGKTIYEWGIKPLTMSNEYGQFYYCSSIDLSPDGRTLIATVNHAADPPKDRVGRCTVYFFDRATRQPLHKIEIPIAGCKSTLTRDGRTLAVALQNAMKKPYTVEFRHTPALVK